MSVIFPAGTSNRIAITPAPALKKEAQFEEEVLKEEEAPVELEVVEEAPVSEIEEVEEANPAFDAIRSLPGFETEVAEIDALEGAESDVASAAAKIEDAALELADAAKALTEVKESEVSEAKEEKTEEVSEEKKDDGDEVAVVELPEDLEKPETEKCEVCGDEVDADKKGDGECCNEGVNEKIEEVKKDDKPEEKIEKESLASSSDIKSIKTGVPSSGFVEVAKLSPENKQFLKTYWKDILGFPADYVDAMVTDYEK